MSAENFDDEFGVGDDLDSLLNDTPPAAKKAAAKKAPAKKYDAGVFDAEGGTINVGDPEPTVTVTGGADTPVTQGDLAAFMAEIRTQIATAFTAAPVVHPEIPAKSPESHVRAESLEAVPPPVVAPEDGTIIHFVEDGFTLASKVFYRGQTYVAPADASWVHMSPTQQIARFGKIMFALGPWQGANYNLDDPALTESDRAKLLRIAQAEQSALAQYR